MRARWSRWTSGLPGSAVRRLARRADAIASTPLVPTCEDVAAVMHAYLDGELPQDAVPMVEMHLAHCERCGIEADVQRRVSESLARLRQVPDADAIGRLRTFAEDISRDG